MLHLCLFIAELQEPKEQWTMNPFNTYCNYLYKKKNTSKTRKLLGILHESSSVKTVISAQKKTVKKETSPVLTNTREENSRTLVL